MKQLFVFLLFYFLALPLFPQQTEKVDFLKLEGKIEIFPYEKKLTGALTYQFKILKDVDSIYLDAKNMEVNPATLKNGIQLTADSDKIWMTYDFKAGTTYTAAFSYTVTNPKQALYFVGWENAHRKQVWSQGQGKDNSHWIPVIDDPNDKLVFDLVYEAPKKYRVIGNGGLVKKKNQENTTQWHYRMDHPISSYLLALILGEYDKKELKTSQGTLIELYFHPHDSTKIEPTYRYSQEIFDFLEQEIGVPYPWANYKMVPVWDFLYSGMENASTTVFSESFMVDSIGFIDRNFVSVNAHELAHQWFGDLVTEDAPSSHWLQEGFASYYALLVEKEIFGEEDFYFKLFQSAEKLKSESDRGKGESLLDPKAGSLTFYEKGAWAVHILREIMGEKDFKKGIKNFLETYKFKNANVDQFMEVMGKSTGKDLSDYVENWLKQSAFQDEEALESLEKSKFIKSYMELASLNSVPLTDKFDILNQALSFPVNDYIGQEAVYQLAGNPLNAQAIVLYQKAFESQNTLVRQAIANSLEDIPAELKKPYESLLRDPSYITRLKALLNLWNHFPEGRNTYLDQLKEQNGFYDRDLRMLWLTLALVTNSYHPEKNMEFYDELSGYTSTAYDYSIRQNAFGYLYQIDIFSEQNYKDLAQAGVHPVWRFRNFARSLLETLLEKEDHRRKLEELLPRLPENQKTYLQKLLDKTEE